MKSKNLKLIFNLQGHQRFKRRFTDMTIAELIKAVWDFDICICPECGCSSMKQLGRYYNELLKYRGSRGKNRGIKEKCSTATAVTEI